MLGLFGEGDLEVFPLCDVVEYLNLLIFQRFLKFDCCFRTTIPLYLLNRSSACLWTQCPDGNEEDRRREQKHDDRPDANDIGHREKGKLDDDLRECLKVTVIRSGGKIASDLETGEDGYSREQQIARHKFSGVEATVIRDVFLCDLSTSHLTEPSPAALTSSSVANAMRVIICESVVYSLLYVNSVSPVDAVREAP